MSAATEANTSAVANSSALADASAPHGGQYRGLAGPAPGSPIPPGPGSLAPGGRATTGLRGGTDFTRWQLWWEFNKDVYLRRQPGEVDGAAAGVAVTDQQRRDQILPALRRTIESTSNRDITSSCMVAIAKIGMDHPEFEILPLLQTRLRRGDQEVRETAALAMGIAQRPDAIPKLIALLANTKDGHQLMGQRKVDDRTRAFSAYALGLIASDTDDLDVKMQVFTALNALLEDRRTDDRDVLVAVLNSLRLVSPEPSLGAKHKRLAWQCVAALKRYGAKDLGKGRQLIQAHVAPAMARILGRGADFDRDHFKRSLAELLLARTRNNSALPQSAALALGQLALSAETHSKDAVYSTTLRRAVDQAKDHQVRYFSMIALAQIGGAANLDALIKTFRTAKGPAKAWAALALGILAHDAGKPGSGNQRTTAQIVGPLLLRDLQKIKNPDVRSALAVGLGLTGHLPSAPELRKMLKKYRRNEELAGYLCIGLALMDDPEAVPLLKDVVSDARRRPLLMSQAATGLARLQQRDAAELLHRMLRRSDHSTITLASAARALGTIGDAGSVEPLLGVLNDQSLPKLLRAFAAASLGMIADDDRLPWNALIAKDINYRAMVETMSNGSSGVLDIL